MKGVKRTYGKKTPVVQKAAELFDKALKEKLCVTVSKGKVTASADQIKEEVTQKDIDKSHKGWNLEVDETNVNTSFTSHHSAFMIFDSTRVEKTKTRKQRARKKQAPSKEREKQNAKSNNRRIKVNQKPQGKLSLPSPADERKISSITPDLVIEEEHSTCKKDQKKNLGEGSPDENANIYSSSGRKKPRGKGLQQKKKREIKERKPLSEKKKASESSSSRHSNSSIEVARKSKDQTSSFVCPLPSSPVINILKEYERKSSEEDIGDISFDQEEFESCGEKSDSQNGNKDPSTHDTSMWSTIASNATSAGPDEDVIPMDVLLQSPEVKMRQFNILNSTAKTAEDNIAQLPFPSTLSPITLQAAEFTPHMETQDKRSALSLPGKKPKTLPLKKRYNLSKCSTRLFTSSTMNCDSEEILDVTAISYMTCIQNGTSLVPSYSPKFSCKVSSAKKGKGSSEVLSNDCKNPTTYVSDNKFELKGRPTNVSLSKSSHPRSERRNKAEQPSAIFNKNNQDQELQNSTLQEQTVLRIDTRKICSVILTKPAAVEKSSLSGKQTVHWCMNADKSKKRDSSAGVSSRESVPKRSILKRSNEIKCNQELSTPLKKYLPLKPIRGSHEKFTDKNLKEMIGDSSICLINRLFMKS